MRIGYERIAYANELVDFIVTCLICVDPRVKKGIIWEKKLVKERAEYVQAVNAFVKLKFLAIPL